MVWRPTLSEALRLLRQVREIILRIGSSLDVPGKYRWPLLKLAEVIRRLLARFGANGGDPD